MVETSRPCKECQARSLPPGQREWGSPEAMMQILGPRPLPIMFSPGPTGNLSFPTTKVCSGPGGAM